MPMLLLLLHQLQCHCRRRWCGHGHRNNIIEQQQLALHNHDVVCQCFIIITIYNNILLEAVESVFVYYFFFSHWKIIIPRQH